MKKIIIQSEKNVSEEDAHFIVYGKLKRENGKLVDNEIKDPDCVDETCGIPEEHNLKKEIKEKFKEFKKSIRTFIINAKDLIKEIASFIKNCL